MSAENETVGAVVYKVAPAVALGGQPIFGYTLPEWAAIAGIVYTLVQLGLLIYDRVQKHRKEKDRGCKL